MHQSHDPALHAHILFFNSFPAQGHVGIKPRRGDGLLFWSYAPDGRTDDIASTHEGCPVIKGAKWTTTFWIHTKPFRPVS
jgi:prolyl 4-hydroxylase